MLKCSSLILKLSNMVLIEFLKDFATKKKGDTLEIDSMVARDLIDKKVAKKRERKPTVKKVVKKDK